MLAQVSSNEKNPISLKISSCYYKHNLILCSADVDVSPCAVNASICDHICTDVMDSFECSCYEGYTLASDRRSCLDTDECAAGTHNCQQRCVNVLMGGGFTCDCELGYLLNPDNHTCSCESKVNHACTEFVTKTKVILTLLLIHRCQ